jgi:hypothetical protein
MTRRFSASSCSRRVFNPHRSAIIGVEEGSGTIDPTGTIRLTGGWAVEPHIRFAASYSGMLVGETAALKGTHVFTGAEGELTRNCSIKLSRFEHAPLDCRGCQFQKVHSRWSLRKCKPKQKLLLSTCIRSHVCGERRRRHPSLVSFELRFHHSTTYPT